MSKWILAAAMTITVNGVAASDQRAAAVVRAALEAQGGEHTLRTLHTIQFDAVGYRNMVEQSERPEGP